MMRRFIYAFLAIMFLVTTSCKESKEKGLVITGTWELQELSTKAITIGSEKVEIYVIFNEDKTFQLYQMLGTGKFRDYAGSWTLEANVLSGTYDDGTNWGMPYVVDMPDDETLVLETVDERYTYARSTLPSSIEIN